MAGLGNNVGTSFSLRARMNGSLTTQAGQALSVWYFSFNAGGTGIGFMGDRYLPSPVIEPIEGETIDIEFLNQSPMPHTIHLHGLDVDQANDGVPGTSFTVPPGGIATYTFVAPHAGTYHYHCHEDTVIHYERGMYGAVIVRPPGGSTSQAWAGGPTFDEEVIWHMSSMDSSWNGEMVSGPVNARFRPDVFLLNGKETADARVDPYTRIALEAGQTAYLRLMNTTYNWNRVSFFGMPFEVVASDGRPLQTPYTTTVLDLGPGERYDVMFTPNRAGMKLAQVEFLDTCSDAVLGTVQTELVVV